MTFSEIISPITFDQFTRDYFAKTFVNIPGMTGRFAHLVVWQDLNDKIGRLRGRRVAIFREGNPIAPEEYLVNSKDRNSLVNARAIERRLRLGDSLVVNDIHELFCEVEAIADSITEAFRIESGANLYAGFKRAKAFGLHFDAHDTLIVQVHGQKVWRVYEPTVDYPLRINRWQDQVTPTKPPVWEGQLRAGDVLYMPRGWWHVAEPLAAPSLHITFSIPQPTGLNLLRWILDDLEDVRAARMPLPRFDDLHIRERYTAQLAEVVTSRLANGVERYFEWRGSRLWRRQVADLPAAVEDVPKVESTTPLILVPRKLDFIALSGDEFGFSFSRRWWRCKAAMRPALECLDSTEGHSIDELAAHIPDEHKRSFSLLLRALVEAGVLVEYRT